MSEKIYKDLVVILFVLSLIFFGWKISDIEKNNSKIEYIQENPFESSDVNIELVKRVVNDTLGSDKDRDVEKITSNPLFKKISGLNNQITVLQEEVTTTGYDPFNLEGMIETMDMKLKKLSKEIRLSGIINSESPQAIVSFGGKTYTVKENDVVEGNKILSINPETKQVKCLMAGGYVKQLKIESEEEFFTKYFKKKIEESAEY